VGFPMAVFPPSDPKFGKLVAHPSMSRSVQVSGMNQKHQTPTDGRGLAESCLLRADLRASQESTEGSRDRRQDWPRRPGS
jgi:hypothetical protein